MGENMATIDVKIYIDYSHIAPFQQCHDVPLPWWCSLSL